MKSLTSFWDYTPERHKSNKSLKKLKTSISNAPKILPTHMIEHASQRLTPQPTELARRTSSVSFSLGTFNAAMVDYTVHVRTFTPSLTVAKSYLLTLVKY